jgi:hypothetical protein
VAPWRPSALAGTMVAAARAAALLSKKSLRMMFGFVFMYATLILLAAVVAAI